MSKEGCSCREVRVPDQGRVRCVLVPDRRGAAVLLSQGSCMTEYLR